MGLKPATHFDLRIRLHDDVNANDVEEVLIIKIRSITIERYIFTWRDCCTETIGYG